MVRDRILVIEDEKNIAELVKYNLEQAGFRVLTASKGDTGLEFARREKPALIVLDLMLPELDGIEICKILKASEKTAPIPILMLTAKGEEADKIIGLELGADDYVTKPFSPRELVARVKTILRRVQEKPKFKVFKTGLLELDSERHVVTIKTKPVELTSKEFDLLMALMEAQGRVLSRDFLLDKVWGYEQSLRIETRTVDMHIGSLRKKMGPEARRVVTVKNVGYRFDHE